MTIKKLAFDILEPRANPAGAYVSSLVGSTLTLTGTDDAEAINLRDDGAGMTIIGVGGTQIDGLGTKSFPAVTAIRIVAKGGDDIVGLDNTNPIDLTGAIDIDLGNSTSTVGNAFNLTTDKTVNLGSVRLKAGDGLDVVTFGGSTATVASNFTSDFGSGPATITLGSATTVNGTLNVKAAVGLTSVELNNTTVRKEVIYAPGDGDSNLRLIGAIVDGNVRITGGRGKDEVVLDGSTIRGTAGLNLIGGLGVANVQVISNQATIEKGGIQVRSVNSDATLAVDAGLTVAGDITVAGKSSFLLPNASLGARSITVTGPTEASIVVGGSSVNVARNITVRSTAGDAVFNSGSLDVDGSVSVVGNTRAELSLLPSSTGQIAGSVAVSSRVGMATLKQPSGSLEIGGRVNVQGAGATFDVVTGFGGINGDVFVRGGAEGTMFSLQGTLTFGRNVTVIGDVTAANVSINSRNAVVTGNLNVTTGNDADTVALNGVRVNGATNIRTNGGGDSVTLDGQASFVGATTIDTGAGDDFLTFAQTAGLFANAVTFTGKATIRAGVGNDQLQLGLASGDSLSRVVFTAPGSTVDGGANLNLHDDELSQFDGTPSITNWTDPTNAS